MTNNILKTMFKKNPTLFVEKKKNANEILKSVNKLRYHLTCITN